MRSIGLTGSVAAGKSEVARAWRSAGVPVVSADDLSREAVAPGSEGLGEVVEAFGPSVLADDGTLDRAALRRTIVDDPGARRRLEGILHPRIGRLREAWLREREAEGAEVVASEIPLLFEAGLEEGFDVVVVVDAPRDVRLERMVEGRGLGRGEAERLMAAQMEPAEKRRRADVVIDNRGTLEDLRAEASRVLERIRGAGAPGSAADDASEGRIRVDCHLHTRASHDCLSDPERVLAAARGRGVERIAVTDHDRLDSALALAERHPDRVIPGEEVRTAEGVDVIGLYIREAIPRGTPAREVCRRVREQGGVVYLPHPYARGKGGSGRLAEELADAVDVVEVFNARLHPASANDPARALAERHGLLRGAGSDAHTVGEVAGAWVGLPAHPNEPGAFLEALEEGRIHGRTAPWSVHLASTWAKIRKRLPG